MKELAEYCLDVICKHPKLAKQINEIYVLCQDEIEAGVALLPKVAFTEPSK